MNPIKELQNLIGQQLGNNDRIEDIQQSLSGLYEVGPTPRFCLSLFTPLMQHALNNADIKVEADSYVTTLKDLSIYMYENEGCIANKLFNTLQSFVEDLLLVLEEDFVVNTNSDFNLEEQSLDSLLCYLSIIVQAHQFIVSTYYKDLTYGSNWNKLWAELPRILACCRVEPDRMTNNTIKAACEICCKMIDENSADVLMVFAEGVLDGLLWLIYDDELSENLVDILANTVSYVIESFPNMKLSNPSSISTFTNATASSLEQKPFNAVKFRETLNLSCLLIKNHTKVPWLQDILHIIPDGELEILREKARLLSEFASTTIYTNPQSEMMDVDQSSITDTRYIIDCGPINKKILDKVDGTIQELLRLNAGDEKYKTLITRIKEISIYSDNTDISSMCQSYIQDITNFVTKILIFDPDMAQAIAQLFDMKLSQFVDSNLRYALPYAITSSNTDDCLLGISNLLELSIKDLCEKKAPHILIALLMESETNIKFLGYSRLQKIYNSKKPAHKELATKNATKITTQLAMNLGIKDLKDQSLRALEEMKSLVGMESMSISEYLSQFIFAILTKITEYISYKKSHTDNNESNDNYEPHTLEALMEVMIVMQPNIGDHALHLMKTFQAINDIKGMQVEALCLWKQFISLMKETNIFSNYNGIIHGLLQILPLADHDVRVEVASTIENVLYIKTSSSSRSLSDLPLLPEFEELESLRSYINESLKSSSQNLVVQLKTILSNLSSPDDVQVLFELQKLDKLLSGPVVITVNRAPLYTRLLYLIRKHSSHEWIPYIASKCLGKLGAVNPSLIDVKIIDDSLFLMEGFSNEMENTEFICGLLSDHIFPAYNATSDEKTHLYMRASIQSLLKCAQFTEVSTMKNSTPQIHNRWLQLPPSMREFLQPFLLSSFRSNYRGSTTQYPIFPRAKNYAEWVKDWYCRMMGVTRGKANAILTACLAIVMSDNVDFTSFLIPYVVFYIVVHCTGDEINNIKNEMLLILDTNAEYGADSERFQLNQQALQLVVSITEYFRKWLNKVKLNDRKFDSSVNRISQFLEQIPDKKMAIAAFNSGAYVQALMHFETYIKSLSKETPVEPSILKYLQHIYTQIDNPIDLSALMDIYYEVLGQDEEITRFETTGRWKEAEVLYKNKLADDPTNLTACVGYMNCLKKWGSYDAILRIADKVSTDIPKSSAQINCFRIDSAWRVGDWHSLNKAVELPVQKKPEALIGCALAKLKQKKCLEAACLLQEAREGLIDTMTSNTTVSYRKSYSAIFNLQLLQELEDSQHVWESEDPEQSISNYQAKWDATSRSVIPTYQYKHNLLELRKAAFFDIRPTVDKAPQVPELLITMAKSCRKSGNLLGALDAITKAEKISNKTFKYEKAKWYWASGFKEEAFQLLHTKDMSSRDALLITKFHREDPSFYTSETIRRYFQAAMKKDKNNEKVFHYVSSYYFNMLKGGNLNTNKVKTHCYIATSSIKALRYGSKYYHSTMSKLINSWFELDRLDNMRETLAPPIATEVRSSLNIVNENMRDVLTIIPPYQFSPVLPRLISHLNVENNDIGTCLINIICGVFTTYPSSIWLLKGASSTSALAVERMNKIYDLAKARDENQSISSYILQANELVRLLKTLSMYKPRDGISTINMASEPELAPLTRIRDLDIFIPTEASLYPVLPQVAGKGASPFPKELPTIKRIRGEITIMRSMQKPKRIVIEGSDGKIYKFLVKSDDDLRKDARSMELNYAINSFLKKNPESRDNELYIRTYAVVPLGVRWGLIQWIDHIAPLKGIIHSLLPPGTSSIHEVQMIYKRGMDTLKLDSELLNHYTKVVLPRCPDVFYKWFLKTFPEPNQWLSSRERYIKTLAVMSIVGYMIGLGDRHAENILFDERTGDCVHVDLNMLFDQGLGLQIPEVVPFRLTHNLVDAMGPTTYKGTFTTTCDITMNVMLQNKDALQGVFKTLINTWSTKESAGTNMKSTEERFQLSPGESAQKKVRELIAQATEPTKLCKMFAGWAPFL